MQLGPMHASRDDVIIFVASECFAVPLNIAAGEAFVGGLYVNTFFGWGIGVPLAIAGLTYHWWKQWIKESAQNWIGVTGRRWWPAAMMLAFIYVTGPSIYRRATTPLEGPPTPIPARGNSLPAVALSPSSPESAPPQVGTDDLMKLYRDNLTAQANILFAPHIGKWKRIDGEVYDISLNPLYVTFAEKDSVLFMNSMLIGASDSLSYRAINIYPYYAK